MEVEMNTDAEKEEILELWGKLEFCKKNPSNDDLGSIIKEVPILREVAGQKLLGQNPSNDDLKFVICWIPTLRKMAGGKLLGQNPSKDDLEYIIEKVPSLRKEVEDLLDYSSKEILAKIKKLAGV